MVFFLKMKLLEELRVKVWDIRLFMLFWVSELLVLVESLDWVLKD